MTVLSPPVVVAVGRSGSRAAVAHAAGEAVRRDRRLHLLHATTDPAPDDVLTAARRYADAAVAGLVPVTAGTVPGSPTAVLTGPAVDAALLVVGRSSYAGHPYVRTLTGVAAARVPAPVLAVPDDWVRRTAGPRVVVGVDEGANGGEALVEAFAAARAGGAALTLLASWWRPARDPEEVAAEVERATASLRAWHPDVPVDVRVVHGPAGEALIEASTDADLVVLGRHEPLLPGGSRLGPVARAVLRDARCPVLLSTPVDAHRVHVPGPRRTGSKGLPTGGVRP
ncbi:universal stress protein [Nocardioides lianchengensis]|uniref:Nucleotide-binding universal stress protein, UspA family n=1 Tax=Nocardioides lianchengensis TaxID=1045774 RepID=A0A1G6YLQ1_9ACTN|nr:universal stress protein [Nocardioides lianchengensis]NYG09618.1 nucleotide-binding universal stress UspA family protein [Nocardioides lianchengensis]SDD90607.1 Nucleotide-binding universal stress protein, UspA family [Nocardioides lianchengensis]